MNRNKATLARDLPLFTSSNDWAAGGSESKPPASILSKDMSHIGKLQCLRFYGIWQQARLSITLQDYASCCLLRLCLEVWPGYPQERRSRQVYGLRGGGWGRADGTLLLDRPVHELAGAAAAGRYDLWRGRLAAAVGNNGFLQVQVCGVWLGRVA